jgi:DNA mismatch repair ATPase MutS
MAGKSVFLKTVGLNLALAYAGGPVDAQHLQTLPFRLFTSIGIADSVTDGISYFYAEVKRLKALLAELERDHPLPLLFCIDEIFRGTNNRERLIGSRAYVRALADNNGAGLIATHDLELTGLADEVPQVENYHFRDRVAGDRMVFDYTLRPGPCPTTNALDIMRLEGLPLPLHRDGFKPP